MKKALTILFLFLAAATAWGQGMTKEEQEALKIIVEESRTCAQFAFTYRIKTEEQIKDRIHEPDPSLDYIAAVNEIVKDIYILAREYEGDALEYSRDLFALMSIICGRVFYYFDGPINGIYPGAIMQFFPCYM